MTTYANKHGDTVELDASSEEDRAYAALFGYSEVVPPPAEPQNLGAVVTAQTKSWDGSLASPETFVRPTVNPDDNYAWVASDGDACDWSDLHNVVVEHPGWEKP